MLKNSKNFTKRAPQRAPQRAPYKKLKFNKMINKGYFKLKDPKATKPSSIRFRASINGERLIYGTGKSIHPDLWDDELGRPVKNTKLIKMHSKDQPQLDAHLINLKNFLNNFEKDFDDYFKNQKVGEKPNKKDLVNHLDKIYKKEVEVIEKRLTLNEYIAQYIQEIESGKRLIPKKSKRYGLGTIKNVKGFQTQFNIYQKDYRRTINFEDVNMEFYDSFVGFFNSKNYSPNTIGKHIANLKTICKCAREENLHQNYEMNRESFNAIQVDTDEIYLNESELKTLFELDLSDNKDHEIARDIFLVGCYVAQRFSDYSRIKPHFLKITSKGSKVICLTQVKTGIKVTIPVRGELDFILSKYGYDLPKINEQTLNRDIKDVGEKAKINELVEIEMIRGGLTIRSTVPKNTLIKTHTARRSGATNMFLAGIPTLKIMKVTGHTTEANLLKYIKASSEETADDLSTHLYFNPVMKAV